MDLHRNTSAGVDLHRNTSARDLYRNTSARKHLHRNKSARVHQDFKGNIAIAVSHKDVCKLFTDFLTPNIFQIISERIVAPSEEKYLERRFFLFLRIV